MELGLLFSDMVVQVRTIAQYNLFSWRFLGGWQLLPRNYYNYDTIFSIKITSVAGSQISNDTIKAFMKSDV